MAEASKNKAELLVAWRARWREADFTWQGLKSHGLKGWVVSNGALREAENGRLYGQPILETPQPTEGAQASLQDYWRADPSSGQLRSDTEMGAELVVASGHPTYHVAHLPLEYDDGTPTAKQRDEDVLSALVDARLEVASETQWEYPEHRRKLVGANRNAQLLGCVLGTAPVHPAGDPLSIDLSLALVFSYCDFDGSTFKGEALFNEAAFVGEASFRDATFSDAAWFESAKFIGAADFYRAAFGGEACFNDTSFSGETSFTGTTFSASARFRNAAFSGGAWFSGAAFGGSAHFDAATFNGTAWFEDVTFNDSTWFGRALFSSDEAWFDNATFIGTARFNNVRFGGGAWFGGSAFRDESFFSGAEFGEAARFIGARFIGETRFKDATFGGGASFNNAKFLNDMDFTAATFERLASFESIAWPEVAAHYHCAFDQVLFRSTLSLRASGLKSFAAFDGARLEGDLHIDDPDEKTAGGIFNAERSAAIAAARTDGEVFDREQKKSKSVQVSRAEINSHISSQREARLRELERGCRVLKLAFERAANKSREQMLYRFELRARRSQRDLPPGEALFSDLYALASDYGASMVRPFVALALLIVLFGAIFLGWGCARGFVGADAEALNLAASQAFDLSWANVFKPLSALNGEATEQGTLAHELLNDATPWVSAAVRALATLQSLLAIVLAFLFALAVRRRFQIN